ncbi:G2/mitotic-specific cyclin-A [Araneus ventricosus]|uniref:G2/mitotic-specific cyclin-A n=1 Tax=Araneus ventricosus TaxID=182803 RepID=A0A4Y2PZM9_ARAVE|nr:G2/mitotic-specific cyclin-A [Araneus ventricosus]
MSLRCYNTAKDDTWYFDLPFESDSDQVVGYRRPFTNLLNRITLDERHPIHLLEQREKIEAIADQENVEPWKKREKDVPFCQNGCKIECEKRERKTVKPAFYDEVQSNFTEEDTKFCSDPELLDSIYSHMKEKENKNGLLFRRSGKINTELRSSIVDYLIYTSEKFKLDTETFQLSVFYFDKFLCLEEVEVVDLPLIELCAVLLACKFEEARDMTPEMKDLIEHFPGGFCKKEILKMEQRILGALHFEMSHPTPYYFLQIFCSLCNVKREERFLAQCICDIALIYEDICFNIQPSQIAAASILLSNRLRGVKPMLHELSAFSHYEGIYLKFTANLLFSKYDKILYTKFNALKIKYGASEYKNVLYTVYPRDLYI